MSRGGGSVRECRRLSSGGEDLQGNTGDTKPSCYLATLGGWGRGAGLWAGALHTCVLCAVMCRVMSCALLVARRPVRRSLVGSAALRRNGGRQMAPRSICRHKVCKDGSRRDKNTHAVFRINTHTHTYDFSSSRQAFPEDDFILKSFSSTITLLIQTFNPPT